MILLTTSWYWYWITDAQFFYHSIYSNNICTRWYSYTWRKRSSTRLTIVGEYCSLVPLPTMRCKPSKTLTLVNYTIYWPFQQYCYHLTRLYLKSLRFDWNSAYSTGVLDVIFSINKKHYRSPCILTELYLHVVKEGHNRT